MSKYPKIFCFIQEKFILLILSFFILFFSTASLATNFLQLWGAVATNDPQQVKIALETLDPGVGPSDINNLQTLPSKEVSRMLFQHGAKPLTPHKFLYLVLLAQEFISITATIGSELEQRNERLVKERDALLEWAVNEKLVKPDLLLDVATSQLVSDGNDMAYYVHIPRQENLMRTALDNGASFSNVNRFNFFYWPSDLAIEIMLKSVGSKKLAQAYFQAILDNSDAELGKRVRFMKHALKAGADVNGIRSFRSLPPIEIVELLLRQGLGVNKCLELVIRFNCRCGGDVERQQSQLRKQMEAVDHIVGFADKQKVKLKAVEFKCISDAPPLEEFIKHLFSKQLLDPTQFINNIFGCSYDSSEIVVKKALIKLALEHKPQLTLIESQELREALQESREFQDINQSLLNDQLYHFFALAAPQHDLSISNAEFARLAKEFHRNSSGNCMGLTTRWLIGMYKQFNQEPFMVTVDLDQQSQSQATVKIKPEQNNDWFTRLTKTIASWDGRSRFDKETYADIVEFARQVNWFHKYAVITSSGEYLVHRDVVRRVAIEMDSLGIRGKSLKKKYAVTAIVNSTNQIEVTALLERTIHDDELVFILYTDHAMGLYKHGKVYAFYDPDAGGVYQSTSLADLTGIIFRKKHINDDSLCIGIMVFSFDETSHTYPKHDDFLYKSSDMNKLFEQARLSIGVGCLEALKLFLKDPIDKEMLGDLLMGTVLNNSPEMVRELLWRKADPKEFRMYRDRFTGKIATSSALQLAEKYRLREVSRCFHAEPAERKEEKSRELVERKVEASSL